MSMKDASIIQYKKELRFKIKQLKRELPEEVKQREVSVVNEELEQHSSFKDATHILMYWAMADEMSTREFILKWYRHKKIYLPVVKGDDLEIFLFEGEDSLVAGEKYGIPEPAGEKLLDESKLDVVIVPGVAFDNQNNRMGRGAGYYDRILKRLPTAKKIGLAFGFQMIDEVPVEPHDIPMDVVITGK